MWVVSLPRSFLAEVERDSWDEQRLRALCARHGWARRPSACVLLRFLNLTVPDQYYKLTRFPMELTFSGPSKLQLRKGRVESNPGQTETLAILSGTLSGHQVRV